ncbi:hypothetical protein ABZV65_30925 [Streptomyces bauhiniae]|uniref:hypothetical protein n=1 Tax=Streptomyces bauhiniae TaxID=2340725 RepID=UPI0033B55440
MTTRITFGDDRTIDVPDDLADSLYDALTHQEKVKTPGETGFDGLHALIARLTRTITHLSVTREIAIARADATGPHANRRAIGIAAAMTPSVLGDVLERNGRPRNRREGTVPYDWELSHMGTPLKAGTVRATNDDRAAEFAIRDAKVRQVEETEADFNLVVRRRARATDPAYEASAYPVIAAPRG